MQVWHADDAAAAGKIADLHVWWNEISLLGTSYWYNADVLKTWLLSKADFQSVAAAILGDTNVQITGEGRPYFGALLGSSTFVNQFVVEKVQQWLHEQQVLSTTSTAQPHAAFAALTNGITSKWSYIHVLHHA